MVPASKALACIHTTVASGLAGRCIQALGCERITLEGSQLRTGSAAARALLTVFAGVFVFAAAGQSQSPPTGSQRSRPTLDLSQPSAWTADSATAQVARQAQAIDPDIRGSYTFDPKTRLYTYSYRVWNRRTAANAIWYFAIAPVPRPIRVGVPSARWSHSYGFEERDDALVWMVVDAGPAPAEWDSVSLWPSPFDIQPGDSVAGFSLTTKAPPGIVSYYAQGFYTAKLSFTISTTEEQADSPAPFTLFQNSLTGTTIGPRNGTGGRSSGD
jgi:hypothetical protein